MMLQIEKVEALSAVTRTNVVNQAAAYLVKGEIALAPRKGNKAVSFFELSGQLDSYQAGTIESLVFAYRKLGKLPEAAAKYLEIDTSTPRGSEAQEHYVLARYELARSTKSRTIQRPKKILRKLVYALERR